MSIPTEICLHQASKYLEVSFDDGQTFSLPCEYLRVYSPSAEVRGHGAGQEILVSDKQQVEIMRIEPIGNYAIKLVFSDGHASGLYSYDYLYELGEHYQSKWQAYLARLATAGESR